MLDRRGLLKLFGVGAVVAPVVNGIVVTEPAAKLITIPEVEIIEPRATTTILNERNPHWERNLHWKSLNDENEIVIHVKNKKTGRAYRMDCNAFMVETHPAPLFDQTCIYDQYREFGTLMEPELTFRVSGPIKLVDE